MNPPKIVPKTSDQRFDQAFPLVWFEETGSRDPSAPIIGSFTPKDPGGYTRGGVALARHPSLTRLVLDSWNYAHFKEWYKLNYWDYNRCGELPWPVALVVFDGEVNQGGEGAIALQRVLGVVMDSVIGPQTIAAACAYSDHLTLAAKVLYNRDLDYRGSANFVHFGRGWILRLYSIGLGASSP